MIKKIIDKIKILFSTRIPIVATAFALMFTVLVYQVISLQVKDPGVSASESEYKSGKVRDIKSTRGNIYDVNGVLLAYNDVSYSVIMEDSGLLRTNAEKNAMLYKLIQILNEHDVSLDVTFGIELDENGELISENTSNLMYF